MNYKNKQFGTVIVIVLLITIFWLGQNLVRGQATVITIGIIVTLIICLILFYSLTVEIKDNILMCRFGFGLIKKNIKLSDIHNVRIVRNPWYSGWGIRWKPGKYVLWNVSGFDAIEIQLRQNQKFRIGTNKPTELAQAIKQSIETK